MNINKLDFDNVSNICENSKQVMVYGWSHCGYEEIAELLKTSRNSSIKKVFNSFLGLKLPAKAEALKTCEGTFIEQIQVPLKKPYELTQVINGQCKAALANLVLENYKRIKEGKQIIPLMFCYDIDENPHPSDEKNITSRDPKINKLITHSELRRCYKLCKEVGDLTVEAVAQKTIKFVKVNRKANGQTTFQEIEPFWLKKDWDSVWKKRKLSKIAKIKKKPWREQLIMRTTLYNKLKKHS